ncbi:MAG: phage integrase N-terminal SAM-like domain-containing protein [Pseudomonadota bacterium]
MRAGEHSQPASPPYVTSKDSFKIDSILLTPVTATKETAQPVDSEKSTTGMSWVEEYARLSNEIQVRHYSPKTLKTYMLWVRHFQTFTKSLDPKSLSTDHVKAFLTFLAVIFTRIQLKALPSKKPAVHLISDKWQRRLFKKSTPASKTFLKTPIRSLRTP